MSSRKKHTGSCTCHSCEITAKATGQSRKEFIKTLGAATVGLGLLPVTTFGMEEKGKAAEMARSQSIKSGKAQRITLLHTADIHGQVMVHDDFFGKRAKRYIKNVAALRILKP